jgi:hypothetical protein
MTEARRFSLIKPTIDTPFHIDFDWWKEHDSNWRVYLHSLLCPTHQELFSNTNNNQMIDWVDPVTAEIQTIDGLQHILITHCAIQPEFTTEYTALVDAVFRLFLANGNTPMSPMDMENKLNKPAQKILQTLSGVQVYKGIRPCITCP